MSEPEYTGKDVSYYLVKIESPKRLDPYTAECEDIIEALGMTFAEGCAFKAIWRKCAARTLGVAKAGYKGGLYDAEKTQHYGGRMVAAELRAEALTRTAPHAQAVHGPRTADTMLSGGPLTGCIGCKPDDCPCKPDVDQEKLERWTGAPEWATCIVERLGYFREFAAERAGGELCHFHDGEKLYSYGSTWVVVESRPCAN